MTLQPPGSPEHFAIESAALFTYGALALPEVMQVLLGRVPASTAASAAGWRIVAAPGRAQAVMVSAEAVAYGSVTSDLSNSEWQLLDTFQVGCELRLLDLTDGRTAWSYVCADRRQASGDDWDADQFEKEGFVAYLKSCAEWRKQYRAPPDDR